MSISLRVTLPNLVMVDRPCSPQCLKTKRTVSRKTRVACSYFCHSHQTILVCTYFANKHFLDLFEETKRKKESSREGTKARLPSCGGVSRACRRGADVSRRSLCLKSAATRRTGLVWGPAGNTAADNNCDRHVYIVPQDAH